MGFGRLDFRRFLGPVFDPPRRGLSLFNFGEMSAGSFSRIIEPRDLAPRVAARTNTARKQHLGQVVQSWVKVTQG